MRKREIFCLIVLVFLFAFSFLSDFVVYVPSEAFQAAV